jgi:hypothetical protein
MSRIEHNPRTIQAYFEHNSSTLQAQFEEQFWHINSGVQNSYSVSLLHFTGLLSPRKTWEE